MAKEVETPDNTADLAAAEAQLTGGDLPIPPEGAAAGGSGAGGAASIEGQPVKTPAELAGAEEGAPAQGAAKEAAGAAVKIRFGDREYTPEELVKQTDVLALMSTQASQASHYQKLHEDRTKRIDELEAKAKQAEEGKAAAAAAPAVTPGVTQDQKRALFAGALKAEQDGSRGQEYAEFAKELPTKRTDELIFVAETWAVADHLFKRLDNLEDRLGGIQGEASRLTNEAEDEAFRARWGGLLDTLAKEPLFDGLAMPEQRKAFTEFFARDKRYEGLNDKDVDQKLVSEAYIGWLYGITPEMFAALRKKVDEVAGNRGRAAGEIGGGRGAGPAADDEMAKAERELEQ